MEWLVLLERPNELVDAPHRVALKGFCEETSDDFVNTLWPTSGYVLESLVGSNHVTKADRPHAVVNKLNTMVAGI